MSHSLWFQLTGALSALVFLTGCGDTVDRRLPGGSWDNAAASRAIDRGVADGWLAYERSRIAVPVSYTSCGKFAPPLVFVNCGPEWTRGETTPYHSIGLAQRFSTKAQLTAAGEWPIDIDRVLERYFGEFTDWYSPNRLDTIRVAQEDLPPGAEACMRFYLRFSQRPLGEARTYFQKSGLFCMKRIQDPPGLLTVAGVVDQSVDSGTGYALSRGFDEASEPILRTLKFTDGKEPYHRSSQWSEEQAKKRLAARESSR